ncbi:MAG: ABC transporter ATP-binding protein [Deltaproteobacteria bacterium]|nr:ABC transporter ATP-binding protein [Deltaproteobacteria bacterium]
MTSLIEVTNLHKAYVKGAARIEVLRGASFSVAAGAMVSVTGKSGAGKSTLLHLIGTLDTPDAGGITYKGRALEALSSADLADFRNRELGFVFQFHHLLPEFSALENVAMPALIRRMAREQATARATQALTDVGLSHRVHHRPGELSGGEQQRVALARALVLDPPLVLADEVTGNLDDKTSEEIHDLLFRINRERGVTFIVVTHKLNWAARMPQRLVIADGLVREAA